MMGNLNFELEVHHGARDLPQAYLYTLNGHVNKRCLEFN